MCILSVSIKYSQGLPSPWPRQGTPESALSGIQTPLLSPIDWPFLADILFACKRKKSAYKDRLISDALVPLPY